MPEKQAKVTRAEWDVLEALWADPPMSAREAHERLDDPGSPQTTRTLLDRLLAKGVVKRAEKHGVQVFSPARSRDAVVRDEGKSFLSRFFDGRPELCAAYFIENENVPPEELKRLKKLLDAKLLECGDPAPLSLHQRKSGARSPHSKGAPP